MSYFFTPPFVVSESKGLRNRGTKRHSWGSAREEKSVHDLGSVKAPMYLKQIETTVFDKDKTAHFATEWKGHVGL